MFQSFVNSARSTAFSHVAVAAKTRIVSANVIAFWSFFAVHICAKRRQKFRRVKLAHREKTTVILNLLPNQSGDSAGGSFISNGKFTNIAVPPFHSGRNVITLCNGGFKATLLQLIVGLLKTTLGIERKLIGNKFPTELFNNVSSEVV